MIPGKIILDYLCKHFFPEERKCLEYEVEKCKQYISDNDRFINSLFEQDDRHWFNDKNPPGVKHLTQSNRELKLLLKQYTRRINTLQTVMDI